MTQAITQTVAEAAKAVKISVRELYNPVNNARLVNATPGSSGQIDSNLHLTGKQQTCTRNSAILKER